MGGACLEGKEEGGRGVFEEARLCLKCLLLV